MTILKDMGVQQWRLRRTAAEIQAEVKNVVSPKPSAELDVDTVFENHFTNVDPSEKRVLPTASEEGVQVPIQASTDSSDKLKDDLRNHHVPATSKSINEELTKPSITPLPLSASVEAPREVTPVIPMPAPVSALIPAPIPVSLADNNIIETSPSDDAFFTEKHVAETTLGINNVLSSLDWSGLQSLVDSWQHCPTCGDEKSLLGHGNINADWLFVVDAPSSAEVAQKSLFAGRSGALFEAMLGALGLTREDVYTSSLFKCIASDDMSVIPACDTILVRQIEILQPKVIVTFGEFVSQTLLKANAGLDVLRTQDQSCINSKVTVVPTFTPLQMLDDASLKSKVWSDLKKAVAIVDMPS